MSGIPALELIRIRKSFGGVAALEDVSLTCSTGEIHALMGGNGAGKSTLMKVLSGVYPAGGHAGEIRVRGEARRFASPADAEDAGIAMIHQELSVFPHLTVAENLCVGHWPTRGGRGVDWPRLMHDATAALKRVGAPCRSDDRMGDLSVGVQQLVEIARALGRKREILILDEPTSALTPREVDTLFGILGELKDQGHTLIYISHKMDEIRRIADRMTILRDGRNVWSGKTNALSDEELITHLIGRPRSESFPAFPSAESRIRAQKKPLLELKGFSARDKHDRFAFQGIDLEIRPGQIVGLAGLLGAGRTELCRAMLGDPRFQPSGGFRYGDRNQPFRSPREAIRDGLYYVSEDRKRESVFPARSLRENAALSRNLERSLARWIRPREETARAGTALADLHTRFSSLEQPIASLSGGNQQKVVLARALETDPRLVILDEPTRGIDVGAKYEIYQLIFTWAAKGKAFLVVSSEIPELVGICDEILVLASGLPTAHLRARPFSQAEILQGSVSQKGLFPS